MLTFFGYRYFKSGRTWCLEYPVFELKIFKTKKDMQKFVDKL